MPRPGCVWTHAILISFADIARFPDLGVLTRQFVRPTTSNGLSTYSQALTLDSAHPVAKDRGSFSREAGIRVLQAVYARRRSGAVPPSGEALDDLVFAVWSQQWPRLRRSFSFRTAVHSSTASVLETRFDLCVLQDPDRATGATDFDNEGNFGAWDEVAFDDLLSDEPTDFRRFLWRYGSDLRRGRDRFRFLANLFTVTRLPRIEDAAFTRILDDVSVALPDRNDGLLLKEDLVSGGQSTYSLVPPGDPLKTIAFFARSSDLSALPPPPATTFDAIFNLWPTRSVEILAIGEQAVQHRSDVAQMLLDRLAAVAVPSSFLSSSRDYPTVRERVVRSNPALLDSADLTRIQQPELSKLLEFLPDDENLAGRVLDRLRLLDDESAASVMTRRFPEMVADRVFDALTLWVSEKGPGVPRAWTATVRRLAYSHLPIRILQRAESTSALAACAAIFEFDVSAGLRASSVTWAAAVRRARDDAQGETRSRLLAYLLSMALAQPVRGCEPLFELAFEPIHSDLLSARLQQDALNTLRPYLPSLYWWQQWDVCLRLRRAVVDAYIHGELDPRSFRRLTRDHSLFEKLIEIADNTRPGQRFLKDVVA
jgi:hypothetical protein